MREWNLKYLGNSLETSGWRLYRTIKVGKHGKIDNRITKRILVAWIDKRCKRCGRFVSKFSHKDGTLCSECSEKEWSYENKREYYCDKEQEYRQRRKQENRN